VRQEALGEPVVHHGDALDRRVLEIWNVYHDCELELSTDQWKRKQSGVAEG
jgi:hypothetical protein